MKGIFKSFAFSLLLISLASSTYAKEDSGAPLRERVKKAGFLRIIKGTLEQIDADRVTISVESILEPRAGELKDFPKRLSLDLSGNVRYCKNMDKNVKLDSFSKGDKVVVIAKYSEDGRYEVRAFLDDKSALKMREGLQDRLGKGKHRQGMDQRDKWGQRPRFGQSERFRGRGEIGARFGRRIPPAFSAIYLGLADKPGTIKLELTGPYRPISADRQFRADTLSPPPGFPEGKKVIVAKVGENARVLIKNEKADISDLAKGTEVVVFLRGLRAMDESEPIVLVLADKESAEAFRERLMEKLEAWRSERDKKQEQPRERRFPREN